ncbi:minor capsid protein, partial [Salmonella enterica]|uniref:minor capsid protein n=1 Tax=Salmonella enterica TaxID=28901 RepID=UPI000CBE5E2E
QIGTQFEQVIRSGLIRGDSIPNMTKQLQKQVGNSEFASERLIRTESNFVMTETTARGYEDNGLEKYQFIAHDDEKTCIPCNRLDNQVFLLSERQQGLNIPPIHPLDRCLIIPYVE